MRGRGEPRGEEESERGSFLLSLSLSFISRAWLLRIVRYSSFVTSAEGYTYNVPRDKDRDLFPSRALSLPDARPLREIQVPRVEFSHFTYFLNVNSKMCVCACVKCAPHVRAVPVHMHLFEIRYQ